MSKYLISEPPLQVLPSLAKAIGLNEAIVLQQIHYWINQPGTGKTHNGRKWIYNSIPNWQKDNFPFWSDGTIKRTIASLKKQKLILSKNLNKKKYDRTLWYTIDYEQLDKIGDPVIGSICTDGQDQDDPMDRDKMTSPIPETTTENTSENTEYFVPNGTVSPPPPPKSANGKAKTQDALKEAPPSNGSAAPRKKEPSEHQQLMAAYQDALGYQIPNGAQEGTGASRILKAGYTIQQTIECYEKMKRDPFWRGKHLSLQSVHKQLGAFVQAQNGDGRTDCVNDVWQSIKIALGKPGKPDISDRALQAVGMVPGGWRRFKEQDVRFIDQLKPLFEEAYERTKQQQPTTA